MPVVPPVARSLTFGCLIDVMTSGVQRTEKVLILPAAASHPAPPCDHSVVLRLELAALLRGLVSSSVDWPAGSAPAATTASDHSVPTLRP